MIYYHNIEINNKYLISRFHPLKEKSKHCNTLNKSNLNIKLMLVDTHYTYNYDISYLLIDRISYQLA